MLQDFRADMYDSTWGVELKLGGAPVHNNAQTRHKIPYEARYKRDKQNKKI